MKVQGVDFKDVSAKTLSFFAKGVSSDAEVQVRIDTPNGEAIALVKLHAVEGDEFVEYKAELLQEVTGVHNLFFIFDGEGFEFGSWSFKQ